MGRHSSSQQWPYYRSLIGWFLPWAVMAAIAGAAVWVAIDALGQDELAPSVASDSPSPRATPSRSPTPSARAVASPKQSPKPKKTQKPEPKKTKDPKPGLITAGITVQVLNGTGVSSADDGMADRLAALGFDVIAIDGSSKAYPATTVFWSYPEAQQAAQRLAQRFGWTAAPKPDNLSATVDIHVVVGADEA